MSKISELLNQGFETVHEERQPDSIKIVWRLGEDTKRHLEQQLLELLESCKPEEKEVTYGVAVLSTQELLRQEGRREFNRATKQYHSNIRKLFED